jgi:hypothetical protein
MRCGSKSICRTFVRVTDLSRKSPLLFRGTSAQQMLSELACSVISQALVPAAAAWTLEYGLERC